MNNLGTLLGEKCRQISRVKNSYTSSPSLLRVFSFMFESTSTSNQRNTPLFELFYFYFTPHLMLSERSNGGCASARLRTSHTNEHRTSSNDRTVLGFTGKHDHVAINSNPIRSMRTVALISFWLFRNDGAAAAVDDDHDDDDATTGYRFYMCVSVCMGGWLLR